MIMAAAWTINYFKWLIIINVIYLNEILLVNNAVIPPPWANPKLNPCAIHPRGWQLLYWPIDGKCYKIFQMGYPCPSDMELAPTPMKNNKLSAECRCPPKTSQSKRDGKCYELFSLGPCEKGEFFGPDYNNTSSNSSNNKWGICRLIKQCQNQNEIFWPKDGQCYQKMTKGPCQKGFLLTTNNYNNLGECKCNNNDLKIFFYPNDGNCYQHFTKGPCREKGHIYLPDRTCGCYNFLPHYYEKTQNCFEIGTIGPCGTGEVYDIHPDTRRGLCQCKSGYIRYKNTTSCYRPYTQGPCDPGDILINSNDCIKQPCKRGYLYFPKIQECHRIGTQGACKKNYIVTFDFETRPSLDGVSYNGVCTCEKYNLNNQCTNNKNIINCNDGFLRYKNNCYKLYTQGPCQNGAWIVRKRHKKEEEIFKDDLLDNDDDEAYCQCVPGYIKKTINNTIIECQSPTVILADYLNRNFNHKN